MGLLRVRFGRLIQKLFDPLLSPLSSYKDEDDGVMKAATAEGEYRYTKVTPHDLRKSRPKRAKSSTNPSPDPHPNPRYASIRHILSSVDSLNTS